MNALLTTGADGTVTVHKDTCKKITERETTSVETQLELAPQKLVIAKKAPCCRPSDSLVEDIEQAAWEALENAANEDAEDTAGEEESDELYVVGETDTEDLIGEVDVVDLIGETEPEKPAVKRVADKLAKKLVESKALDGADALKRVADYLDIELGEGYKFPGFGKAFKTTAKQSIYINSKGSADARAADAAQADAWATLDHVERRSGNSVRISLGNI